MNAKRILLIFAIVLTSTLLIFCSFDNFMSCQLNEAGVSDSGVLGLKRGSIPIVQQLPSSEEVGVTSTASEQHLNCAPIASSLPSYIVLGNSGGGHTNQILHWMIQASIAEICGIKIVLGNYTERRDYAVDYKDSTFVEIPLTKVISFDENTPVLKGRILNFRQVVSPIPDCGFNVRLANLNDVNCYAIPDGGTTHSHFDSFKIPFHRIVSFFTSIKIASKDVLSRCEHVKKAIRPFTCWHPRNEKDWTEFYNVSKVDFAFHNKFIVSGVKKVHWSGKSYFKEDFNVSGLSPTEKLQLDFCVCTDADHFVGVLKSTFSYYIWIVRLAQNRLTNRLVSDNGIFWSSTMHEMYVTGIAGYFNLFLSEQIVVL